MFLIHAPTENVPLKHVRALWLCLHLSSLTPSPKEEGGEGGGGQRISQRDFTPRTTAPCAGTPLNSVAIACADPHKHTHAQMALESTSLWIHERKRVEKMKRSTTQVFVCMRGCVCVCVRVCVQASVFVCVLLRGLSAGVIGEWQTVSYE